MNAKGEITVSLKKSRLFLALALVAGATLAGGVFANKLNASPEKDTPPLDEYADILTTLSDWAPEPVAPDKIVYASIHGMLARLDPHTAFLEPDEFSAMREKQHGSFYGLGIQIQKRMGKITVIAPMEGTPAYKMGIRAGDIITHIADEELKEDTTTEDVVRKLRGPKGTTVAITIRRVGFDEPIRMTITRAEIPTRSVRYAFLLEPGVGYIMLSDFTHTSSKEVSEAIQKLEKQGMKKLLLDLRGNPGGVLEQAVDVTDVFVPKGSMVTYTRAARPRPPRSTTRRGKERTSTTPSSCSSTGAPLRPPRSWPVRSRTTTAGSWSDSARGVRASSRASTPSPTAPGSP